MTINTKEMLETADTCIRAGNMPPEILELHYELWGEKDTDDGHADSTCMTAAYRAGQLNMLRDLWRAGYALTPRGGMEGWIVRNELGEIILGSTNSSTVLDMIEEYNDVQAWIESQ